MAAGSSGEVEVHLEEMDARKGKALCEECSTAEAKYTCPACGEKTCSLKCCKKHKERTQCTGKRDVTKYVPMDAFGERELLSDISFLDGVKRARDVASKGRPIPPRKDLPPFMKTLRFQARKRGVRLLFMQPGMKRRRENSSAYNRPKDQFSWRIEWHFGKTGVVKTDSRVEDGVAVRDILCKHLDVRADGAPLEYQKLKEMIQCGAGELKIFLKQRNSFEEMEPSKSLSESLCGKTIVEFPQLHVALQKDASEYASKNLVSSST